jgi:hypothetical protein
METADAYPLIFGIWKLNSLKHDILKQGGKNKDIWQKLRNHSSNIAF